MNKKIGMRNWAGMLVVSATLAVSGAAHAAPAEVALLATAERMPNLQERLPPQALENSAVVGQLTPGLMAASSIAVTLADGSVVTASRQRDVAGPMNSKTWVGEFDGATGSQMVLTEHKGVVAGFFFRGDAVYEIVPSRSRAGAHVMYRVDESRLPPMSEPPVVDAAAGDTTTAPADSTASASGDAGTVIDVMVVYTPASRNRYGQSSLEAQILSAVAGANQAYLNSNIDMSLNLVYLGEIAYVETGDMTQALYSLQGKSDGKMDEVHALRDQYGADLVSLIDEDSNYCGYAYTMRSVGSGFASYGFSVVRSGCLSNLSFQHELGHNMGAYHDRESATNVGAYDFSYGYRRCASDGYGFRTVMAYPCSGGPRVNYFSEPTVGYNGYPTGIAHESSPSTSAENARTLRNTMSLIAGFRGAGGGGGGGTTPTAPAAPASATAIAASDQRVDVSWSDASSDESGFRIERSPNGVDWSEVGQVGANVRTFADNGLSAGSWYYYRVRAWNSAGTSGYSNVASARTQDPPAPPPPLPAAPADVAAMAADASVTVLWIDQASNEAGFEVLREKYNARKGTWGGATTMQIAGADITSLVDSPGSGTFRYSVRSYNAGGASVWVGPASASIAGSTANGGGGGKGSGSEKPGKGNGRK